MKAPKDLWDEVRELVAAGKEPVIKIPPGARIVAKVKRAIGRPRVIPIGASRWHRWKMKTPAGHPMRCRNFGCNIHLRSTAEDIVCSPACGAQLREFCETMLDILDKKQPARNLPPHLRSWRLSRLKKKEAA